MTFKSHEFIQWDRISHPLRTLDKDYVGETSRLLETRVKEHLSRNSSAVHEHCQLTGHLVDSSKTKVLVTEVTHSNAAYGRQLR